MQLWVSVHALYNGCPRGCSGLLSVWRDRDNCLRLSICVLGRALFCLLIISVLFVYLPYPSGSSAMITFEPLIPWSALFDVWKILHENSPIPTLWLFHHSPSVDYNQCFTGFIPMNQLSRYQDKDNLIIHCHNLCAPVTSVHTIYPAIVGHVIQ